MRFRRAGVDGLLVEPDVRADVARLHAELRRRAPQGLVDIVPAATTVLLVGPGAHTLEAQIPGWTLPPAEEIAGDLVEIPVTYDGEDLAAVAAHAGCTPREVATLHAGATYTSAFCGFAPGFAYLEGLPLALQVPRRPSPRASVPAGSVAIAGAFTGVYPRASPGGWQLLGRTDAVLWDARRASPALIAPGTRVRFVERGPS